MEHLYFLISITLATGLRTNVLVQITLEIPIKETLSNRTDAVDSIIHQINYNFGLEWTLLMATKIIQQCSWFHYDMVFNKHTTNVSPAGDGDGVGDGILFVFIIMMTMLSVDYNNHHSIDDNHNIIN